MADPLHQIVEMASEQLAEGDGHEPPRGPNRRTKNILRLLGIAAFVVAGCYGVAKHMAGDTVFALVGVLFLAMSMDWDDVFKSIPNSTMAQFSKSTGRALAHLYRHGDIIVRFIMLFLAVGGTALVCKYGIENFNYLPPYLDAMFKRIGPGFAVISIVLYPASLLSKRVYELSVIRDDVSSNRYELSFYVAVTLFVASVLAFAAGFPMETLIPGHDADPVVLPIMWSDGQLKVLASVSVIWLIWSIATGSCVLSRYLEWSWRDRPVGFKAALSSLSTLRRSA